MSDMNDTWERASVFSEKFQYLEEDDFIRRIDYLGRTVLSLMDYMLPKVRLEYAASQQPATEASELEATTEEAVRGFVLVAMENKRLKEALSYAVETLDSEEKLRWILGTEWMNEAKTALVTPATEAATSPERVGLYEAIKHGDETHRAWLKEAIECYFTGKPVPPPRSTPQSSEASGARESGTLKEVSKNIQDNPVLTAVLAIAILLLLLVNLDAVREWVGIASPKALGRRYRDWLIAAGYRFQDMPSDDCHFRFLAFDPQGRPIQFGIQKKQPGVLWIACGFTVSAEAKADMGKMDAAKLNSVAGGLAFEMARYGVLVTMIAPPFENVSITTSVPADDSLDEYRFFEKTNYMRNGFVVYSNLLSGALNWLHESVIEGSTKPIDTDLDNAAS